MLSITNTIPSTGRQYCCPDCVSEAHGSTGTSRTLRAPGRMEKLFSGVFSRLAAVRLLSILVLDQQNMTSMGASRRRVDEWRGEKKEKKE